MKKNVLALLLAWMTLFALFASACSPASVTPSDSAPAEWTVTVETPDGEKTFSSKDAGKLTPVTMEATTTNKNGESNTSTYKGVRLADILDAVGVSDFSSVSIVAADDFSADYGKELALDDNTVLAWEKDGAPLSTDPPLQMAPKNGVGNQFVKAVAKIVVNP